MLILPHNLFSILICKISVKTDNNVIFILIVHILTKLTKIYN